MPIYNDPIMKSYTEMHPQRNRANGPQVIPNFITGGPVFLDAFLVYPNIHNPMLSFILYS